MEENNEMESDTDGHGAQFHVESNWDDDGSPAMDLIDAVAAVTGRAPDQLRPLYEVLDPDALDGLFRSGTSCRRDSPASSVSFRYEKCQVTVRATGSITVRAPDAVADGPRASPRR